MQFFIGKNVDFFDNETLTFGLASTPLTASKYNPAYVADGSHSNRSADVALVTVEDQQIRWWANGNVPTATEGHLSNHGDVILVLGINNVRQFRAFALVASATLQVQYGRL